MKTNKILMAMALPVAFAACTSEDVLESTQTDALSNRKVLDNIEIVLDGVDSRFAVGDNGFVSTVGDGFGAALADQPSSRALAELPKNYDMTSYIQTNYKYAKGEGEGYNTTAEMVEGNYVFYAPYNNKHLSRKPIEVVTPITQTLDVLEDGSVDKYSAINNLLSAEDANPMFVSYQFLPAVDQPTKLNLTLKHIFAYPEVTIANNKTEDVTITKYVIKTNSSFPISDALSNEKVRTHLYNWGTETFTNNVSSYGDWVSKTAKDAKWLVGKTADILADAAKAPQSDIIVVEIPDGLTIPAGGEQTFHVVMPGMVYTGGFEAYAYINDSEGYRMAGTTKTMTLNPGQRFPKEEFTNSGNISSRAGELMTTKIAKTAEPEEISVLFPVVVSTTKELEEAVLNGTEKFRVIPITDEVAIDETIVAAMRQVNFQGMEIDGDIIIKGGETAALELKEEVEVKGTATIEGSVKLNKADIVIASAKVAEGASLEIAVAEVGSIENYGIVNIKKENDDVNVTNYATLNIDKQGWTGTYTAGTETLEDEEGEEYTQVVATALVNVNAVYSTSATKFEGAWNVKANMTASAEATIYGTMTVDANKELSGDELTVAANAVLTVYGRVNNDIKLAGNYEEETDDEDEVIEVAKLEAKATSFIKGSVAGEDNIKDVNLMTIENGAYFFSMRAPLDYEVVTALYTHEGNVTETSDLKLPEVANALKVTGYVTPGTDAEKGIVLGNEYLAYTEIVGDVLSNKYTTIVRGKYVKLNNAEIVGNFNLQLIDAVKFEINKLELGNLSNLALSKDNKVEQGVINTVILEDADDLNLAEVGKMTLGNITARGTNVIVGAEVVFNASKILLDDESELRINTDAVTTQTADLHVQGNVSFSGKAIGYSESQQNYVEVCNVKLYNGSVLTIEEDATLLAQTNVGDGHKIVFTQIGYANHLGSGTETTTKTGKVVNYGKVYKAAEYYGGYDAEGTTNDVAAKTWWTAKTGSVCTTSAWAK